ncbi:unnamed protein product [Phaedon cochleariae]|uniref:Tetraspanin n=1 Tax=Phaedon cochleariae TaxID=80249 RepID=A0A9N9SKY2_PHACE|nr:unnamed protein product [Phaedon cochleariae]
MGCAEGVVKLLVFSANLVFALGGLALIIVGVLYKLNINDYLDAIPNDFQNIGLAPTFTIVVGSVIFVIAFFGCCGAIRESPCLLTTYSVILLVIFLLQIAVGVFAFLEIKDDATLKSKVDQTLTNLFNKYNTSTNSSQNELADLIQQEFECCGTAGTIWPNNTEPASCHENKDYSKTKFRNYCSSAFSDFLHDALKVIGITVLALSALEVIGSIFSLCLSSSIRNRDRRFRY